MVLFYVGGYVWKRQRPKRASEIDLDVSRVSSLFYVLVADCSSLVASRG